MLFCPCHEEKHSSEHNFQLPRVVKVICVCGKYAHIFSMHIFSKWYFIPKPGQRQFGGYSEQAVWVVDAFYMWHIMFKFSIQQLFLTENYQIHSKHHMPL